MWIVKIEGMEHWRLLLIKRKSPAMEISFSVKTARSLEQLAVLLADFAGSYGQEEDPIGIPIDFSVFYDRLMTTETVEVV